MRCESSVTVPAAPAEAFPWLIEPERVKRWMSNLEAYEQLDGGPLGVGSRFRQVILVGDRKLGWELQVVRLDPPRTAELHFTGAGFDAVNQYAVSEASEGARVTWVLSGKPTSFKSRMIASMVESRLQQKLVRDLEQLRTVLASGG